MSTTATSTSNVSTKTKSIGKAPEASFSQLMSAAASVSEVNGKRMYKTRKGEMVEMPPEMTLADAVALENEAMEAEKKLGKGPPPLPTPDVEGKVKAKEKKGKDKKEVKPKGRGAGKDKKGVRKGKSRAGGKTGKSAIKGKVGAWLMARGAPVVARGEAKLKQLKTNEQKHEDAVAKLSHTEKAVVPPLVEGQSTGNSAQVTAVDSKPAPQPDEQKAKAAFDEAIADNIPRSIEDVDNFKRDNKAAQMSAAVAMSVKSDKSAVETTFSDMKQEPPPVKSDVVPEPLPPEEIAPVTAKMNLGAGTIAPLQKEHTDVSKFTKDADSKLTEEGVTQEQLDMVDSGDLAEANKEKKGMEKKAKSEPEAIRQFAQQETKKVDTSLQQEEAKGKQDISKERKKQLAATKLKQQGTKTEIEKKREEVANKINDIYKRASEKVTKKLADLETQSMKRFDEGNAQATREFDVNVKQQMDAFKDDRYSGFFGWARRAKDWLLGMDDLPQVKAIFDNNRAIFVTKIDKLTASISEDNKKAVQECKDELVKARAEIKAFVDKLGPDLKEAGKKAQEEMSGKLDALDETVTKKEEDLANKLKDKQQAAIKAIDEKIEKMKEEMSGALAKLGALLLLAAKKFFTWALEKFGFSLAEIESIISKGAAVLKAIFTQPIRFVKNLVNAAITGFKNFGKNFLKHLKNALFEWLTGSLEGLVLPQVWDFKGIIGIALQMVGITYQNMRKHMVVELGEPVVSGLEKTFTLVKTLVTEGPIAAWEQLKEMAGEMRDAFVDAVKDFIKTKIIEQAIQWIISIFVPGAGIIKAIIGIYDTIVFFIQKAKQIMQMIGNFLSSIGEIAAGNIGAAADAMENGLARGLSLVINFLAQLLHLNGITAKIREALQKIRAKVDGVMAKVAKWIADKAKKLFAPVTKKVEQAKAWGKEKVEQGKEWVKGKVDKVLNWWSAKKSFKGNDGKPHSLYYKGAANNAVLFMASDNPEGVEDKIVKRLKEIPAPSKEQADFLDEAKKYKRSDIDGYIATHVKEIPADKEKETETIKLELDKRLDKLKDLLVKGGIIAIKPLTNVTYTMKEGKAGTVHAMPLTSMPGNTRGAPPSANIKGWDYVSLFDEKYTNPKTNITIPKYWVKFHLLNHHLHGPGSADWNLTPARKTDNDWIEALAETNAKSAKDSGEILYYKTHILSYHQGPFPEAKDFPAEVSVEWGTAKLEGEKYVPDQVRLAAKAKKFDAPPKLVGKIPVQEIIVASASRDTLAALFTTGIAAKIVDLRMTAGDSFDIKTSLKTNLGKVVYERYKTAINAKLGEEKNSDGDVIKKIALSDINNLAERLP